MSDTNTLPAENATVPAETGETVSDFKEEKAKANASREEKSAAMPTDKEHEYKETVKSLTAAKAAAEERAAMMEAKYTALAKNVRSDAVDDVIQLALPKVSKSMTLEQAIIGILEKYPEFTNKGMAPFITTGAKTTGSGNQDDDSAARQIMGLAPRK